MNLMNEKEQLIVSAIQFHHLQQWVWLHKLLRNVWYGCRPHFRFRSTIQQRSGNTNICIYVNCNCKVYVNDNFLQFRLANLTRE